MGRSAFGTTKRSRLISEDSQCLFRGDCWPDRRVRSAADVANHVTQRPACTTTALDEWAA